MERELCGKWMPRAKENCARYAHDGGNCTTAKALEHYRTVSKPRYDRSEKGQKSIKKYRSSEKGRQTARELQRQFRMKPEVQQREAAYRKSLARKIAVSRYRSTAKGMLTRVRENAKARNNR